MDRAQMPRQSRITRRTRRRRRRERMARARVSHPGRLLRRNECQGILGQVARIRRPVLRHLGEASAMRGTRIRQCAQIVRRQIHLFGGETLRASLYATHAVCFTNCTALCGHCRLRQMLSRSGIAHQVRRTARHAREHLRYRRSPHPPLDHVPRRQVQCRLVYTVPDYLQRTAWEWVIICL